jgi:hypothetical protein
MKVYRLQLTPEEDKKLQRVMKAFACSSLQQYLILKIRADWLAKG